MCLPFLKAAVSTDHLAADEYKTRHGEHGRILAQEVGRIGFLARKLLDCVPKIMNGGA